MEDIISVENAKWLSENGFFYIYHRFGQENENHPQLNTVSFVKKAVEENWKLISISVGVNEKDIKMLSEDLFDYAYDIDFITIDVAHADHENIKPVVRLIKEKYPETNLIVGNVATKDGAIYLNSLGVDCIKIGIGGGSICTTRYMTGFHIPTLQSIFDINEVFQNSNIHIPLIADGGAKHYGDIAKALTFGSTMVMSGGWFASCIDSPAKIINGRKIYRGSTSYELKGHKSHIEGRQIELVEGTTYEQRLNEIKESFQSSISYAGGNDISAFKYVEWGRILPFN
jgi:GMP reductase